MKLINFEYINLKQNTIISFRLTITLFFTAVQ